MKHHSAKLSGLDSDNQKIHNISHFSGARDREIIRGKTINAFSKLTPPPYGETAESPCRTRGLWSGKNTGIQFMHLHDKSSPANCGFFSVFFTVPRFIHLLADKPYLVIDGGDLGELFRVQHRLQFVSFINCHASLYFPQYVLSWISKKKMKFAKKKMSTVLSPPSYRTLPSLLPYLDHPFNTLSAVVVRHVVHYLPDEGAKSFCKLFRFYVFFSPLT